MGCMPSSPACRHLLASWHADAEGDPPDRRPRGRDQQPTRCTSRGRGTPKLDLVRYFLAVADEALTGVRGRRWRSSGSSTGPRRSRSSRSGPRQHAGLDPHGDLPSRPAGPRTRSCSTSRPASPGWRTSAASTSTRTSPAEDLDHPDELRVDLDPVPGVPWSQVRDVALVTRDALEAVGLTGWPKTSGSRGIHINVRIEPRWTYGPSAPRSRSPATSSAERRRSRPRSGGRRSATACSSTTTRAARTARSPPRTRSGPPDARVSFPLRWDEVPDVVMEDYTLATVPAIYAERGDAGAGSTRRSARSRRSSSCPARHEAAGEATRRGRRTTRSGRASRRGSSRPASARPTRRTRGPRQDGRLAGVAAARAAAVPPGPNAGCRRNGRARRRRPRGRRRSTVPVIELGRAPSKAEVYEGLERWKARHPEAARTSNRPT